MELTCSGAPPPPPSPPPPPPPLQPAAPEQWQVDALKAAVLCGLRPIIRIGQRDRNCKHNHDSP